MRWMQGLLLAGTVAATLSACHPAQRLKLQQATTVTDSAWAANSVNVTVFRKNALVTFGDTQYVAFYNAAAQVVTGKRALKSTRWQLQVTPFKGNVADAHNVISLMADGEGCLHLTFDHHNNALHYARSTAPGSLQFGRQEPMTGKHETRVTYPEFYRVSNGDLLFFYRDGGSGQGNLVINRYSLQTHRWQQLQENLVDGEGRRNAYWQACTDVNGAIHLSWVWRESPDVASNHDMCYAVSHDGGITWQQSTGKTYQLPITAATAEYAWRIPRHSGLINQTSMFADEQGHPYVATYWNDSAGVAQYRLVYHSGAGWQMRNLGFRKTPFSLGGMGTKSIPIARPQIVAWQQGASLSAALVFRDAERGSRVSLAYCADLGRSTAWKLRDITSASMGNWEPAYDTELWKNSRVLSLFVQNAVQVDGEGRATVPPQPIRVLDLRP